MITTTAEIVSIDYNSNSCSVRVPLFENLDIGSQAIMNAKISVQPGSFNSYKSGDLVWVTFINGGTDTALIIGKIYKGPGDASAQTSGSLSVDSLKVTGEKAELPAATKFNIASIDYDSIDKLVSKIKDLEIQNTLLIDEIKSLQKQVELLNEVAGGNILRDSDGEILTDMDNEVLHYHTDDN